MHDFLLYTRESSRSIMYVLNLSLSTVIPVYLRLFSIYIRLFIVEKSLYIQKCSNICTNACYIYIYFRISVIRILNVDGFSAPLFKGNFEG